MVVFVLLFNWSWLTTPISFTPIVDWFSNSISPSGWNQQLSLCWSGKFGTRNCPSPRSGQTISTTMNHIYMLWIIFTCYYIGIDRFTYQSIGLHLHVCTCTFFFLEPTSSLRWSSPPRHPEFKWYSEHTSKHPVHTNQPTAWVVWAA